MVIKMLTTDQISRNKIISDINKSLFVEASAGSGKTTMLVRRMVAMIESDKNIDISKICAITFTKAAATEFYERFQKLLSERSKLDTKKKELKPGDLPYPTPTTCKRCIEALKKINLCFLGTIDSFCNMVLSEHPNEANIPQTSSIKTEQEMDDIYLREYSKIINHEYGIDAYLKYQEFIKWFDKPKEVYLKAIKTLIEKREFNIVYDNSNRNFEETIKIYEENIKNIVKYLLTLYDENTTDSATKPSKEAWNELKRYKPLLLSNWNNNYERIFKTLSSVIKNIRINEMDIALEDFGIDNLYFKTEAKRGNNYYELKGNNGEKSYIEEAISLYEEQKYSVCIDFISSVIDDIAKNLRKNGELSFFDYLLYLRNTLRDDIDKGGNLINHIYERHSYFLIDEFQDTDPLQSEIFFYLSSKNLNKDWTKCVPKPGSLFIVGDPKQSIYRFKNADVTQFMRVKKMFKGEVGEVCYLHNNFRSVNAILEGFNSIFENLLSVETDSQSKYERVPNRAIKDLNCFKGYYKYSGSRNKDLNNQYLVKLIKELVNNDKYEIEVEIKDKNGNKEIIKRKIEYKDIMVIPYTKTPLIDYIKYFYDAGIPFFVEGKTDFNDSPIINTVMSIFKLLSEPDNKNYLYEVLSSNYFNYNIKDFDYLINHNFKFNINSDYNALGLDESYCKDLDLLKSSLDKFKSLDVIASIYYIIDYFKIFKYVSLYNLEYFYFTIELIRSNIEAKIINNKKDCIDYYNSLINENTYERCLSLEQENNKVHLANLHKVKGLEAPVCILPFQSGKGKNPDKHISVETNSCYIFNIPKGDFGGSYCKSEKNKEYQDLESKLLKEEDIRKLYVAVTRAKNVLIVGSCIGSKGENLSNPYYDLLPFINDYIEFDLNKSEGAKQSCDFEDDFYNNSKHNDSSYNKGTYKIIKPSELGNEGTETFKLVDKDYSISPTLKGTMVHRLMELMVKNDDFDNPSIIDYVLNEFKDEYSDKNLYKEILYNVYNVLHNGGFNQEEFFNNNIIEVIKNSRVKYTEMPFSYNDNNNIIYGIMDLVINYKNEWIIIDYKTNEEMEGLTEHYKNQLDIYKKYFEKLTNNSVKCYIYHIDC